MTPFDAWLIGLAFICLLGIGGWLLDQHPEFTERWARRIFGG